MIANVVLHAPKKHERRHEQQCTATRSQHSPHLLQARDIIIEMLDHIKSGDQIKRSILVRQSLSSALPDGREAASSAKLEGFVGNIDTFGNAKVREHLQICPGSAANIQDARLWLSKIAANSFDKSGNDAPASCEPPVLPLDLVHDRVSVRLHLAGQLTGDIIGSGSHRA